MFDTMSKMKSFMSAILAGVNDAVTVVDTEGVVLYWNDAAERTYGITTQEIVGQHVGHFFQKESVMLYQVMESRSPVHQVYHEPRPDMHVMINALPVFDDDGSLLGAISIEQNISQYVQLNGELYDKTNSEQLSSSGFPFKKEEIDAVSDLGRLNFPLLLTGDSGVGKRALAQWLSRSSGKSSNFVSISCSSVPGGLMESELFGLEGGVLNDNATTRTGKLEDAASGSVFLKDLHALPPSTQEKLAHAISTGEFTRVGGSTPVTMSCRIFASVPSDYEQLVECGDLLKELFYAFQIKHVPSLAQRKHDIPELSRMFLQDAARRIGKPVPILTAEIVTTLTSFDWPGNMPQFKHAMEHILIASQNGVVTMQDLPPTIKVTTLTNLTEQSMPLNVQADQIERARIKEALTVTKGNKSKTARLLAISRGALYYKMKQHNLE
ncbi:sigma 54-interacting transcriptional regulator [Paenibacillus sp. N1-5-1-14]|uniref:sigma 54-interacting transcriptional regulator n=1 Tax=Paenibacillus radicibacter TaxID=2972488 RepID=UPI00215979BC|nr:sigma 54-interacting transcriptional regulator [Paenibacillus radicibacter]MCR8643226.1 sigma 54-interacting transcriptional regulator [Paenibacillus radicibacter]